MFVFIGLLGVFRALVMISHSHSDSEAEPPCGSETRASTAEKLYQTFIISLPVSSAFIILFFFYLCYLRRQRANWSSLQMPPSYANNNDISRSELGLKKELREMLPIIVYKESFSIRDSQCSVCLVEYQAEDRLQHIPACGHTFHMDCIDHWLATHTTCPLCRLSLVPASKSSTELPHINVESGQEFSVAVNGNDTSIQQRPQASVAAQAEEDIRNPKNKSEEDAREVRNPKNEDARSSDCVDHVRESRSSRDDIE
ncbi:RING-H2 finger protein ATL7-like isoform X2 [Quercus robur]|uniref:RING-H2 finger protein ATL7-like isoform X2 n=1 Tax=Quercus robur TaxID=38942 RepID=UPI0021639510|nr:RING-H2 finger protein ATL7-like isoform X2 [Quercus robur]